MPREQIHCSRKLDWPPEQVWALLKGFDLAWHPFVTDCKLMRAEGGAWLRDFRTSDGGHLVEQRDYISDWDRVLCYTALSGIEGAISYRARVEVTPEADGSLITWHADITARADRSDAIAQGTRAVFEAGLDRLARGLPKAKHRKKAVPSATGVSSGVIEGTPRLSYLHAGARGDTLVLFLHGIGGRASNWIEQISGLGADFNVAAMDLRGYGDSTLGFKQTLVEDYCEDILALVAHLGASRLVLVGLSMGSWIATSFAMRRPDKLAGLVLAGGCTGMSEADPRERESFRISREVPLSQGQKPADFAPAVVEVIAGPKADNTARQALHQSMADIPTETYRDALNCFTNPTETFDFARISCPVLMITGEHDRLAPAAEIRRVSERILDAGIEARGRSDVRFEVLAGAGHVCNLEQPAAFNAILRPFLNRLPGVALAYKPSREEKQREKRQSILDAAHREFCEAGFDGASMDRLAHAADVSKPTLYQYFGDKEGLFSAVLDQGRAHIVAPLFRREGSLVDRLWRFSWTYAEFVLRPDMLSLARLILGEAGRRPETAIRYHQNGPARALDGLVEFVATCVAAGELEVDDPRLAANDLWSLILSGPRDHYLHHATERPGEAEMLTAIAHGLRVFLRAYSTHVADDLEALSGRVAEKEQGLH